MKRETQEEVLKWMLGRAYRAKHHKKELEDRLERINEEREAPIGSPGYEMMPRTTGPGAGAASILFKLADIEDRIIEQKGEIEKAYIQVMDIIDFIPQAELARRIFELRHLDSMNFTDIAMAIPLARSRCYEIYNDAIDRLLEYPRIRKMVNDAAIEYCQWYAKETKPKKSSGPHSLEKQNGIPKPEKETAKKKRKK